jgi:hypothetical protein
MTKPAMRMATATVTGIHNEIGRDMAPPCPYNNTAGCWRRTDCAIGGGSLNPPLFLTAML